MATPVIVHNIYDIRRAAMCACKAGTTISLHSAPSAAHSLGPELFAEMVRQALTDDTAQFIQRWRLDCGADPGVALRALHAGCKSILIEPDVAAFDRLKSIADQMGGEVIPRDDHALDLGQDDVTDQHIIEWIAKHDR